MFTSVAHRIVILVTADLTNILLRALHVLIHESPQCYPNTGQVSLLSTDEVTETQRGQTTSLGSHSSQIITRVLSVLTIQTRKHPPPRIFPRYIVNLWDAFTNF